MANVKPFICVRPNEKVVDKVAALPYDVYNRKVSFNYARVSGCFTRR